MNAQNQKMLMPETDEYGFLLIPEQWNEELAASIASLCGVEHLNKEHWLIINSLRQYYNEFSVAPAMNHICNKYHKDKMWIHNLFGTCLNAWYVAGLPNPGEEAKSYLSDM